MNEKELCLELANAETEEEVVKILKNYGYWTDPNSWKYFGNVENNRSQIGNQQAKPESALIEKIINSVDHVLIKECLLRKINPESDEAPSSIWGGVERFFGIEKGELTELLRAEALRVH